MRQKRWIGLFLAALALVAACSAAEAQQLSPVMKVSLSVPTTTATQVPCPVPCECMYYLTAEARWGTDGYEQCSGTVCGAHMLRGYQMAHYCFRQKPVTTPAPACTAPCECLSKSAADTKWGKDGYTQCSQAPCSRAQTLAAVVPYYCYKPLKMVTAACREGCSCLPQNDAEIGKLSLCDGKKTGCGSSVTGLPLYCYENPAAVTRVTAAATASPLQMVTGVAVAPVTLQAVGPAHIMPLCQLSGELERFSHESRLVEVQLQEAISVPRSCPLSPPYTCIGPLLMTKEGSEPFSVPVSREGDRLVWKTTLSCNGTYQIAVREALRIGECIPKGSWTPLKANFVVMVGSSQSGYDFRYVPESSIGDAACRLCNGALPSSFDWRDVDGRDWVTPVRAQHSCGSCWAMATLGVTEAMYNIEQNATMNLDLSEQNFISCPGGGGTCSGGWPFDAATYMKNTGVVTEACFPYTGHDDPCSYACAVPAASRWTILKHTTLSLEGAMPRNTVAWKRALLCRGPLAVCDHHHCVTIVGWDDAVQSWIFKNSWGEDWGTDGYSKRLYTDDQWMLYAWWFGGVSHKELYLPGVIQYAANQT